MKNRTWTQNGSTDAESTHNYWRAVRKGLSLAFFALVGVLLVRAARNIEWSQVIDSVRAYESVTLIGAGVFAAWALLMLSSYDLLGRAYTGHSLSTRRVMSIGFVSYVFSLNLGALVGGVAFRFRLYSRQGLKAGIITRIYTFSILTNWSAYTLLTGLVFVLGFANIPDGWRIDTALLRALGIAFLLAVAGYLLLCGFAKRRSWRLRAHELTLPSGRLALLQVGVAAGNWLANGAMLYILFQQQIPYTTIFGVYLMSSVAALLVHIPAGLGVLEAVFILFLQHELPRYEIVAALLAYRAIYYLIPLMLALPVYFGLETRGTRQA